MKNYPDQLAILYHGRREQGITNEVHSDEYEGVRKEIADICSEIQNSLPKDKSHLLMELDSAQGAIISILEENGYRFGFKDAFRLSAALTEIA